MHHLHLLLHLLLLLHHLCLLHHHLLLLLCFYQVRALGSFLGVTSLAAIGGTQVRAMGERLRAGVHLVVGTPGRLRDVIERRHLTVDAVRYLVLDEADDLLSRGFRDQIYDILQLLPPTARVGLFSATLPPEVAAPPSPPPPPLFFGCRAQPEPRLFLPHLLLRRLTGARAHRQVPVGRGGARARQARAADARRHQAVLRGRAARAVRGFPPLLRHRHRHRHRRLLLTHRLLCSSSSRYKLETLCELYCSLSITQAIIFVATRRKVEWLTEQMHARDFTCSALHADLEQPEREAILEDFRGGTSRVLIATDVLARGIDVQQVRLASYQPRPPPDLALISP